MFELGRDGASADLKGQIKNVVFAAESILGVRPHPDCAGPLDSAVPDSVRPHLVAVIVEALSNVGRHAEAQHVDVEVSIEGTGDDARVVFEVRDDDKGFTATQGGSGLANMRDRARDLGGACDIRSAEGERTVARWTVPLRSREKP